MNRADMIRTGSRDTLMMVDARTSDHDIVDNAETAFTDSPAPIAIANVTIGQNGSLVHHHAARMQPLGGLKILLAEEVPRRSADHLIRSVAKDVDDGIG